MWGTTRWQLMHPKVHISSNTTWPPRSARRSGPSALSHVSLVNSGAGPRSGNATTGEVDSTIVSSTPRAPDGPPIVAPSAPLQGAPAAQPTPRIDRTVSNTPRVDGLTNPIGGQSTRETL